MRTVTQKMGSKFQSTAIDQSQLVQSLNKPFPIGITEVA